MVVTGRGRPAAHPLLTRRERAQNWTGTTIEGRNTTVNTLLNFLLYTINSSMDSLLFAVLLLRMARADYEEIRVRRGVRVEARMQVKAGHQAG
jgi:hypothetical protein